MQKSYNTSADVFVKIVPIPKKRKPKCPYSGRFTCSNRAINMVVLGNHSVVACDDFDHIRNAALVVAQAFVDEMLDLHGNVPEWKK